VTKVPIAGGEYERLVTDEDASSGYAVEVGENPVRISHDTTAAERGEGRRLEARQTHNVGNLRGDALYAAAYDGATSVRVNPRAADVESQPTPDVRVVSGEVTANVDGATVDVSSRSGRSVGKARLMDSSRTLIDPATDATLTQTLGREIETWSAGALDVTVTGTPSVSVDNTPTVSVGNTPTVSVAESNATGVSTATASVSTSSSPLPALAVPDGEKLTVKAAGESDPDTNDDAVLIDGTFSLAPGEAYTLAVVDASNVSAVANSGTQTLYLITEAV